MVGVNRRLSPRTLPPNFTVAGGPCHRQGLDVCLFLAGMMIMSELARLFVLIYSVGVVVTVLLSNDATAVVLTPAVLAAVRAAEAEPLPYLLICAFIANAASFVLPISNPANLVVYSGGMPSLGR